MLGSTLGSSTDKTTPEILGELFPPLARYWPDLRSVSPPQFFFLLLPQLEAFYGGAAGGGKSAALLAAALQYVDHPGYHALLLRRTYTQLAKGDALIPMSHEWLSSSDARWNEQYRRWTFPSGATLEFGHVETERDKYDYQGGAWQFTGFDELSQFSESQYLYVGFSRQRRRTKLAEGGVPVRIRSTANPGGEGHAWVKSRFVDADSPERPFVPAKVWDNPGLDAAQYAQTLSYLPDELRAQLLDGDWDAFEGMAFDLFDKQPGRAHVVAPLSPPNSWERFESMDFGLNHPTCWLAWAVDWDGNLVCYDSIYEPALPSEMAPRVLARRGYWHSDRCWADPTISRRTGGSTKWGAPATIETEFADHGVPLLKANNDPRAGYAQLRELIKPDLERRFPDWHPRRRELGSPRVFVVGKTCPELVAQLASAPLQPLDKPDGGEKVDPDWEGNHGHAVAAARYGAMSRPLPSKQPELPIEDPRAALLQKIERRREAEAGTFNSARFTDV